MIEFAREFSRWSVQDRQEKIRSLTTGDPSRVPIIISSTDDLVRTNFVFINKNANIQKLLAFYKSQNQLKEDQSVIVCCKNRIVAPSREIDEIYLACKNEDDVLYIDLKLVHSQGN